MRKKMLFKRKNEESRDKAENKKNINNKFKKL